MEFMKNLTSVLQAADTLGYRYLQVSDSKGICLYKSRVDVEQEETAKNPLYLTFAEDFMGKLHNLCKHMDMPIAIRDLLGSYCAVEWEAWQKQEATRSERAVNIRHKPNRLTAVRAEEVQYLLTLNGVVKTNPGDWIIRGVNGEEYPCDPEIFKKLYDIEE